MSPNEHDRCTLSEESCSLPLVWSSAARILNIWSYTGKNATLLIHEATLEDDLEVEAIEKMHR